MFRVIVITSFCLGLVACGGGKDDPPEKYEVSAATVAGGHLLVSDAEVVKGYSTSAYIVADLHYKIAAVKGCSGKLLDNYWYVTGSILADCEITATFVPETFLVSVAMVPGGTATPATQEISYNSFAKITITPDAGYRIKSVSGCNGVLTGTSYLTGAIDSACTIEPVFEVDPTAATNSSVITGVAAEGAALGNTAIFATCANGSGFLSDVVTDSKGNFSGKVATSALPCALSVTAPESGTQYVSLATDGGRTNITPFTSLVIAFASQQTGKDWFMDGDLESTHSQLPLAQQILAAALVKAGYVLPDDEFLPFSGEFKEGDDWDKLLDELQLAIKSDHNIGDFDALVNLVKDGNLASLPSTK